MVPFSKSSLPLPPIEIREDSMTTSSRTSVGPSTRPRALASRNGNDYLNDSGNAISKSPESFR